MLVIVEAEAGYVGIIIPVSLPLCNVSMVQISRGRPRGQIFQGMWINALLHCSLALNSTGCSQVYIDKLILLSFPLQLYQGLHLYHLPACFEGEYSGIRWSFIPAMHQRPGVPTLPVPYIIINAEAESSDASDCRCWSCLWCAQGPSGGATQPQSSSDGRKRSLSQEIK